MTKVKDLTGEVFERWKVLERAGSDKRGGALWLCKCKCGTVKKVMRGNLVNNISKSCGCLHNEQLAKTSYKHGLSTHPLYYIWWHMVDRCNNHKNKAYQDYGGRGFKYVILG